MSVRDTIFAAIPASARSAAEIARDAAILLERVPDLRPDRVQGDPAEAFLARVTGPVIGATASRVRSLDAVPAAVRDYLSANALPSLVALQPHNTLQNLHWPGIATHCDIATDEAVSICIAVYAIAETGSLVFRSGPDMPVLFSFLPMHQLVVVEAASVVAWLEDCAAIEATRPAPRNLNLVTGASGTTDIEGALVRGAHGPGHLHIILVQPNNE